MLQFVLFDFFKDIHYFYSMDINFLVHVCIYVCMYVCMYAYTYVHCLYTLCLQKTEKGTGCKSTCECWELSFGTLQKQKVNC